MAQVVDLGNGGAGKIRKFWVGFSLSIVTLGFYYLFWYYFVNDELKDVGATKGDQNLATSSPALSVVAVSIGGWLILPPFLSVYNYGTRIQRAQRLGGIDPANQISPVGAFLLYFPGALLVIPYFLHFWYVTKHQNAALLAAAGEGTQVEASSGRWDLDPQSPDQERWRNADGTWAGSVRPRENYLPGEREEVGG